MFKLIFCARSSTKSFLLTSRLISAIHGARPRRNKSVLSLFQHSKRKGGFSGPQRFHDMDIIAKTMDVLKNEDVVKKVATVAIDYAITQGLIMRTRGNPTSSEVVQPAPFTLFPSPVPKNLIDQAYAVQQDFNFLMHAISRDFEFVKSSFSSVIENDEFTRKLFDIYTTVNKERPKKTELAIIRSDYMFHQPTENGQFLKQIEINMIASGLCGIGADIITDVHKFSLRRAGHEEIAVALPKNETRTIVAQGFVSAWNHYGKPNAVIVFIVTESETNIFDQRTVEFTIFGTNPEIKVLRYTLADVAKHGKLDADNNIFIEDNEIAVIYYRAGYAPINYPTEKEWSARLMLDRSNAINCPSVGHQLVGAKKMQQVLSQPRVLERFIKDSAAVKRIRDTFVGFDSLEMGEDGDASVAKALQNPNSYVLKPQLEGGGNNLYNADLVDKLNEIGSVARRCSYILMEKVRPMLVTTVFLRPGTSPDQFKPATGVSELGIFGTILANGDTVLHNKTAGHLLRTKGSQYNDSGLMTGISVIDSPLLI